MKNSLMISLFLTLSLGSVSVFSAESSVATEVSEEAVNPFVEVEGASMVFLLTTSDPIRVMHALHMAETTHGEGHPTAIILLTEGARLASKELPQPVSPLGEANLQEMMLELIEKGISIGVAPPSMTYLGISPEDLVEGVTLCNKGTVMARLFAKGGKIITW